MEKLLGKQSKFWDIIKSPGMRYMAFRDVLDTLIYALSMSRHSLFFVQVGSNDATHNDPLQLFLTDKRWQGIMIEPVNYVFKRLTAKYGGSPRFVLENVAIAEIIGNKDFYYLEESTDDLPIWYDQLGSFSLPTIMSHADLIPNLEQRIRKINVECITFKALCDRNAVKNIDLIHLDTESFDYEILKLIDFCSYQPALILYEHKHLSKSDQAAAQKLLIDQGYEVLEVSNYDTIAISNKALATESLLRKSWQIALKKLIPKA